MIAAIGPVRVSPIEYRIMQPSPIRSAPVAPVATTPAEPLQTPEPPFVPQGEPNQISPPIEVQPVEIIASQAPAVVPASASVATPAPDTSSSFSFMDWLTEETIVPGYPNGLIGAGGVIALAWIFSGKKKRR